MRQRNVRDMKTIGASIAITLGIFGVAIYGDKALPTPQEPDPYKIKGELVRDYVQDLGSWGKLYRMEIEHNGELLRVPVVASEEKIRAMERDLVSREERGTQGDQIGINPNTHVTSLDEAIYTPRHVKKIK